MKKIKITENQFNMIFESALTYDSNLPEYPGSTVTNGFIGTDSDGEPECKKNVTADDFALDQSSNRPDAMGSSRR